MDDLRQQRDRLKKDLQLATEALNEEVRSLSSGWTMKLGPFRENNTISLEILVAVYVLFNVICFATGIGFIFLKGAFQALGIALVVGSVFSFGTFMAQWWDHAWQRQKDVLDRAYGDVRYVKLGRLVEECKKLNKECDKLDEKLKSLAELSGQDNISEISRERSED